jgi:Putative auto-transporter adhesin, head GIN domain
MKNTLFLALVMAIPLSACGYSAADAVEDIKKIEVTGSNDLKDGKAITALATDPGKFTSISSVGPDDVVYKVGDAFSVSASGSAKALENLRFTVKDGDLTVGRYKYSYQMNDTDKAVITITAPSISAISAAGSGDVKAERVNGPKVSLSSAGSGSLNIADVETASLDSDLAGSGNVTLSGKVDTAAYSIAGSGTIDATKMASSSASVSIAGSGDVNLTASGNVSADIAGSGDVNVTGGAKCTSSIVGSGKLNCG